LDKLYSSQKWFVIRSWKSLTIPKGNSAEYNIAKFEKPRHTENFMDKYFKNEKK
jgi:hypothetical protein